MLSREAELTAKIFLLSLICFVRNSGTNYIKKLSLYSERKSGTAMDVVKKELLEQKADENAMSSEKQEEIDTSWYESDVPANTNYCQPANEIDTTGIASVIEKNVANIKHAYQCTKRRCLHPKCKEIKTYLEHKRNCGFCPSCKLYNNVICFHARHQCRDLRCIIEDCIEIRCLIQTSIMEEKLKELPASMLPPSIPASICEPGVKRTATVIGFEQLYKIQYFLKQKAKIELASKTVNNECAEETASTSKPMSVNKCTETCIVTDEIEQLKKENENLKRELEILKKENEELKASKI